MRAHGHMHMGRRGRGGREINTHKKRRTFTGTGAKELVRTKTGRNKIHRQQQRQRCLEIQKNSQDTQVYLCKGLKLKEPRVQKSFAAYPPYAAED